MQKLHSKQQLLKQNMVLTYVNQTNLWITGILLRVKKAFVNLVVLLEML